MKFKVVLFLFGTSTIFGRTPLDYTISITPHGPYHVWVDEKLEVRCGKDFLKMIMRLTVSVAIVLSIHYVIIPGGYEDINFAFIKASFGG